MDENVKVVSGESVQYVVVSLGNEQYGIDISYVDNIVRMQKITRVPKAQPYYKGVINIRGEIIPVMSLRVKFGLDDDQYTGSTRILILKIEAQAAVGIIVDEVKEVITLSEEDIEKPGTKNGADEKAEYLVGVGKHDTRFVSILNLANVIIEKEASV